MKEKKTPIIILHGWGLRGSLYADYAKLLRNEGFEVLAPDLPGFGDEPLENDAMKLGDYVAFVDQLIKKNKWTKVILIGHSFGGRIAIKYAWQHPEMVQKLILTGAPVVRNITFRKRLQFVGAMIGGKVFSLFSLSVREYARKGMYRLIGEWDYYKSGPLKRVFVNIIGEDVAPYAKELKIPILLVWGEKDRLVPVRLLPKIKKIIPHATVTILPNIGHTPFRDNNNEFWDATREFLCK